MIDKVQEPPDKENDQEFIKLSGTICQVYKKSFIFNSSVSAECDFELSLMSMYNLHNLNWTKLNR
jgi:hypothetical protein